MHARQMRFSSQLFGDDLQKLLPSSSRRRRFRQFDNLLELLVRTGRVAAAAVMMMSPGAWQNDAQMSAANARSTNSSHA